MVSNECGRIISDEEDMGMTYEELGVFGRLRKVLRCGPVRMFLTLVDTWKATCTPTVVAEKVSKCCAESHS